MLSKEEKLKYGEILRQQMKQREDKKKQEQVQKRGNNVLKKSPTDRVVLFERQANYVDPKQILQQQLSAQQYNPYGKGGSGAPNRLHLAGNSITNANYGSQPQRLQLPPQELLRGQNNQPEYQNHSRITVQPQRQNIQQPYQQPSYQPQQYQQQPSNQVYPSTQQQNTNNSYPPPYQQDISPQTIQHQKAPPQAQVYEQQNGRNQSGYYAAQQPERIKTYENQELQEVYKRGGRNLLRMENQTVNEHLVKQKQKLEIQSFLKAQIQEAQRKKQQEKQRMKRQQLEQERKNREYLDMQRQKIVDQERKKNEKQQKIIDQNVRNLEKRKQQQEQSKRKIQRERQHKIQADMRQKQAVQERQYQQQNKKRQQQVISSDPYQGKKRRKPSDSETSSVISSESAQDKSSGFNTQISRQFFKKEKQRQGQRNDKKLEGFTNEILKMKNQINNQGQIFQHQIHKIKMEAQSAHSQKKRAQMEIQRLKNQLIQKNKDDESKLFQALKRNDKNSQPEYSPQAFRKQKRPSPEQEEQYYESPKQKRQDYYPQRQVNEPLEKSVYNRMNMSNLQETQMMTLDSESKKIPLDYIYNQSNKLTMSNLGNMNNSLAYGKSNIPKPRKYEIKDSIAEESQQRVRSKQNYRNNGQQGYGGYSDQDELDKFVDYNRNSKAKLHQSGFAGEDITNQIEELLKKKQISEKTHNKISSAGRQIVSREALPYNGPGLSSLNQGSISVSQASNNTFDIDKIHNRNEHRLRELKKLGVQTINTSNDEEINKLDAILRNYN